ncbi:hypothetical protein BJ138DRAFT_1011149, partial [Hygrophoropsis aurantiaca]
HQSYYTCLSRSASAEGTVIMQAFDRRKITGGASGWLRQEYRMLELLDEITLLKYNNECPEFIQGHRRNSLASLYQQWKGRLYVPCRVPRQIRWNAADPLNIDNGLDNVEWKVVDKKKFLEEKKKVEFINFVPAKGSKPVETTILEKRKAEDELVNPIIKKKTPSSIFGTEMAENQVGLKWDSVNYSCAYDSLFTILFHIWFASPHKWNKHMKHFTEFTDLLLKGFQQTIVSTVSIEEVRDNVRYSLNKYNDENFPLGPSLTSVSELAHTMLGTEQDSFAWIRCENCSAKVPTGKKINHIYCPIVNSASSTADWLTLKWFTQPCNATLCSSCNNIVHGQWQSDTPPKMLMLDIFSQQLSISHQVCVKGNKLNTKLHLKGVIYYKDKHFTSIVIDSLEHVWYHDGMTSPKLVNCNVDLSALSPSMLMSRNGSSACLVIYSRLL